MIRRIFKGIFDLFSSFGFAVACLLMLLVLTFLGTLYQVDHGLYEAQKVYFTSGFLIQRLGPIAFPLPGAYLVMTLLAINLVCGGIIRIRKNWRTPGILVVHVGMLFLLTAGFVTYHFSQLGYMKLYEGGISDEFADHNHWMIEIGRPEGNDELLVIPEEDFRHLGPDEVREFHSEELPFDLAASGYEVNAYPRQSHPDDPNRRVVDGFYLQYLPKEKDRELNVPGIYVEARDKDTGTVTEGILWGLSDHPLTVESGGELWTVQLARERWQTPFAVQLEDVTAEFHPGTERAAAYASEVTRVEGDEQERTRIWMNHPLRKDGFTFFQSGYGRDPDEFTVFQVVRNPADQWPLYATLVIAFGLLVHFLQKLVRYMRLEAKRRAA